MTRHKDLDEPWSYNQLAFVEFLDFICRVAIDYYELHPDKQEKTDLEDKTFDILS